MTLTEYQTIHIKTTLTTKYNLLTGNTAIGKSLTAKTLKRSMSKRYKLHVDFLGNRWRVVTSIDELLNLNNVDVVLIDESLSKDLDLTLCESDYYMHDEIVKALKEATCKFIFIVRGMHSLPIDYKSVYTLDGNAPVSNIVRLFNDYMDFNSDLPIIIEDSTTGLEYYRHWFKDVESSFGKNNLRDYAFPGVQIVADGSAIGYSVQDLLDANLYLPESFEYDLASHWRPKDTELLLKLQPDDSESVEQYFENKALPAMCIKYHLPVYKKDKHLIDKLLKVQIHGD